MNATEAVVLSVAADPDPRGLAHALRVGTRKAHRAVERGAFVRDFLRGVVTPESYGQLLGALHHVYTALESGLESRSDHPAVRPFCIAALRRRDSLARDLRYFTGSAAPPPPSRATRRYVARLAEVTRVRPLLLIAHAYTRYMGDLSGGRVLRRIVDRALRPHHDLGLAFYDFPEVEDLDACKREFRARLDAVSLRATEQEALVAEANRAFAHNAAVFAELEGSAARAALQIMASVLRPRPAAYAARSS